MFVVTVCKLGLRRITRRYERVKGMQGVGGSVPLQLEPHALWEARYWGTIVFGRDEMILSW